MTAITYEVTGMGLAVPNDPITGHPLQVSAILTLPDGSVFTAPVTGSGTYTVNVPTASLSVGPSLIQGSSGQWSGAVVTSQLVVGTLAGNTTSIAGTGGNYQLGDYLPIASITQPIAGDNVVDGTELQHPVTISGYLSSSVDPTHGVTVTVTDGAATPVTLTVNPADIVPLANGMYSWSVSANLSGLPDNTTVPVSVAATDANGTPAISNSVSISIDSTLNPAAVAASASIDSASAALPTGAEAVPGDATLTADQHNAVVNLVADNHSTLLYPLLNAASATGGDGVNTVNGFTVGTFETTPNASRIDVSHLLIGYAPAQTGGPAHYTGGTATIDAGDTIASFLQVTQVGNNTVVSIDRDGAGSAYQMTTLLTLTNVHTDLATLLANHQIVI
jgi:hypothetical protein